MEHKNNCFKWMDYALKEPIAEAIFDDKLLKLTAKMANESYGENRPEQSGYFGGIVNNGQFFIFNHWPTGFNRDASVTINPSIHQHAYNVLEKRIAQNIPSYKTVMYHTHPKITASLLRKVIPDEAEKIIEFTQEEISYGIYDYLKDKGISVELDESLNEFLTRNLSQEDVNVTRGNYHLLITNPSSLRDPFFHLNFYKLNSDKSHLSLIKTSQINKIQEKWLRNVKYVKNEIRMDFNKEFFGFRNFRDFEFLSKKDFNRAREIVLGYRIARVNEE